METKINRDELRKVLEDLYKNNYVPRAQVELLCRVGMFVDEIDEHDTKLAQELKGKEFVLKLKQDKIDSLEALLRQHAQPVPEGETCPRCGGTVVLVERYTSKQATQSDERDPIAAFLRLNMSEGDRALREEIEGDALAMAQEVEAERRKP